MDMLMKTIGSRIAVTMNGLYVEKSISQLT
jgi:hypothetical protein